MPKTKGKRKGAWLRKSLKGQPWYWTGPDGKDYSLRNEEGEVIKGANQRAAAQRAYKVASAHWEKHKVQIAAARTKRAAAKLVQSEPTIRDLCDAYLMECKERGTLSEETFHKKANLFFEFCEGYAQSQRELPREQWHHPIHKGYGNLCPSELTEEVLEGWFKKHDKEHNKNIDKKSHWKVKWIKGVRYSSTIKTYVEYLASVFNWAVNKKDKWHIAANPLKGIGKAKANIRERGFSLEEKEAIIKYAQSEQFRFAFDFTQATGSRNVCEFGRCRRRHVHDTGEVIEIQLDTRIEGKRKRGKAGLRRIIVPTRFNEIIRQLVRNEINPERFIFRTAYGRKWNSSAFSRNLHLTIAKIYKVENPLRIAKGLKPLDFSWGAVFYSTRHTFAQEAIATGEIGSDTLAAAMDNSRIVCERTYAKGWEKIHSLPPRAQAAILAR